MPVIKVKKNGVWEEVSGSSEHTHVSSDIIDLSNKLDSKYEKPSNGIPKTDLASDVKISLGKADTALQSYTETDPTVPSWAKASTKPSYTYDEVGAAPSNHVGDVTHVTSEEKNLWNNKSNFSGNYNDLSDKPTSLPANGGNADTLDGKHADDFASSSDVENLKTLMPTCTSSDNGKFLTVVDGVPTWVAVDSAEEVAF